MRCWCGYLSGVRCRLSAYGAADATAIPKPGCRGKEAIKRVYRPTTTLLVKKTRHLTLAHNFTKYWPIFKILSLLDSVGNV